MPRTGTSVHDTGAGKSVCIPSLVSWSSAARAVGLPQLPGEWEEGSQEFHRVGRLIERLHDFHLEAEARIAVIVALFPYGVDAKRVVYYGETALVCEALTASMQKGVHAEAHALKRRLDAVACDASLPFGSAFDDIRSVVGNPDITPRDLAESWRQISDEALRLDKLAYPTLSTGNNRRGS